ncbi:MAG: hypothetical protein ACRDOB_00855 [Streptosporangiaceae bacterium]
MTRYTESDLRAALKSEAAGAPRPAEFWPGVRRRIARRRALARAGAALAIAAVVAVALETGWPAQSPSRGQDALTEPVSYQQACAGEPGACAAGAAGPVPAILDRPLHLPAVARGQACPVTPGQNARNGYVGGLQFGSGPVSMIIGNRGDPGHGTVVLGTTQLPGWYALENVWLSGSGYQGPFMVRGQRLDGPGLVGFGGSSPAMAAFVEPPGPDANTNGPYRTPPGSVWLQQPGCYGFQIDGLSFSETIVIDVLPSP